MASNINNKNASLRKKVNQLRQSLEKERENEKG